MTLTFGVDTLCRFCKGQRKGEPCKACGGVGFTRPAPSNGDVNSDAAARSVEPVAGAMRRAVLEVIRDRGPVTTEEVERILGGSHQSVSARVYELHNDGHIDRVDKAPTSSGRMAWRYAVARA